MWVRMEAFLDTTPNEATQNRRQQGGLKSNPKGALAYLADTFNELGQIVSGDGGQLRPLNWSDLAGYSQVTGTPLAAWECKTLIDMSVTYLSSHFKYKDPRKAAPIAGDING